MTKLTVTGEVFKDIALMVVMNHGFGSNKMVRRFDLYDFSDIDFNLKEVVHAYFFLIENEYIREYTPSYMGKSYSAYNYGQIERKVTKNGTYIGLTAKGWAVANKYLNA